MYTCRSGLPRISGYRDERDIKHCYPKELTDFICEKWAAPCSFLTGVEQADEDRIDPLPDPGVVEQLISTCYQASLLREEERPVRFRLILQEPDLFDSEQGPPKGLHRLVFTEKRPCNEYELRRLSQSIDFYHSLIGVVLDPVEGLQIWGLLHSGPRWVQTLYGGGKSFQPLPGSLVIHVTSPGRVTVCRGSVTVATLNAGQIICPSEDVFDSQWLRTVFDSARIHVWRMHLDARSRNQDDWAVLHPEFLRIMKKQVMMRVISRIRHSRHGGTLVCIPEERVREFSSENPYVDIRYRFAEEEPRRRFETLLLSTANSLAEAYRFDGEEEREVGWAEYLASKNQVLSRLDEAIFEWAHLVAGLAAVDGAVFITRRFEILGFGGEISGRLEKVDAVRKALDLEGEHSELEQTWRVGTRHHSVYRLCNVLHDVIGMVVSQDGSVQVVHWKDGAVTCWDQVATSVMDV